jgi:TnpA family transposase
MHLLGLDFEPRIPRLSDRRLYGFEPAKRYGRLASLFGRRLDRDLIVAHWSEITQVIGAMRNRTVTPSLILKKLSAYRQQNSLAAALREVGRIERTLFTLRWFEDPALRRMVTAELNKGEARNSLARAVAFHRLGRFRDRGLENQQMRAAALASSPPQSSCSTAAISVGLSRKCAIRASPLTRPCWAVCLPWAGTTSI